MPSITIRPILLEDAESVQKYASDSKLAATCNVPHPYPSDGGISFVERSIHARKEKARFPSAILVDGAFAGVIGLNTPDYDKKTVEVDYWVAVPYWGKGIATQAVACAIHYAFEELQMETIFSGCWVENPASGRVLEKNGFLEIPPTIGDQRFGQKSLGKTIRQFRLDRKKWIQKGKK
jgi:ribosomal-protein-alanine N-acetyltransferase